MCDLTKDEPPTYGVLNNMAGWLKRQAQSDQERRCPRCYRVLGSRRVALADGGHGTLAECVCGYQSPAG